MPEDVVPARTDYSLTIEEICLIAECFDPTLIEVEHEA